jgi:hypothetical protein
MFEPDLRTMGELVIDKLTEVHSRVNRNDVAYSDLAMCIKAVAKGNLS